MAAWVRSETFSLERMTPTWHFTVASVMPSSLAISLLFLPFTIRFKTSRSRELRSELGVREDNTWEMGVGRNLPPE